MQSKRVETNIYVIFVMNIYQTLTRVNDFVNKMDAIQGVLCTICTNIVLIYTTLCFNFAGFD